MLRSLAVTRIQDALGFHYAQSDKIILRLQEAQRELEMGKTLPKFLLQEDQTFPMPISTFSFPLPAGFLRLDVNYKPFYMSAAFEILGYLRVLDYQEAFRQFHISGDSGAPRSFSVRNTTVNLINPIDQAYIIGYQYYKSATSLATDTENEWLANAPEWLIGEAGWRMAMDKRDKDAVAVFDNMRKTARAAVFGEIVADEDTVEPMIMGANL